MVNRKRDIQKFFRVNEEEDKMIKEKMKQIKLLAFDGIRKENKI